MNVVYSDNIFIPQHMELTTRSGMNTLYGIILAIHFSNRGVHGTPLPKNLLS
jgi:hypothetical protein